MIGSGPNALARQLLGSPWWVWVLYIFSRLVMATSIYTSDLVIYMDVVGKGGLFPEYGPLANAIIWLPAWISPQMDALHYLLGIKTLAVLVDVLVFQQVIMRSARPVTLIYLVASTVMAQVWMDRLDIYVGALLVVALLWPGGSPLAFGGAALIKFPYVGLAAIPFLQQRSRASMRNLGWTLVIWIAVLAAVAPWLGMATTLHPLVYHGARTPQLEGLLGNLLFLLNGPLGLGLRLELDHAAFHVHGARDEWLRVGGVAIFFTGLLVTAWRLWLLGMRRPWPLALFISLVAYTVFNPLGCPQYAIPVLMTATLAVPWDGAWGRRAWVLLGAYGCFAGLGFSRLGLSLEDQAVTTLARNLVLLGIWGIVVFKMETSSSSH